MTARQPRPLPKEYPTCGDCDGYNGIREQNNDIGNCNKREPLLVVRGGWPCKQFHSNGSPPAPAPDEKCYIITEEVQLIEDFLINEHCVKCPYEGGGVKSGIKAFIRSRPHSSAGEPAPGCSCQMVHVLYGKSEHVGPERFNHCKHRTESDWLDGCSLPYPPKEHDQRIRDEAREKVLDKVIRVLRKPEQTAENPNGWLWQQRRLIGEIESLRSGQP